MNANVSAMSSGSSRVMLTTKLKTMKKKNGVVETHYGNGKLQSRANYKDDKLDGLCETWNENGQLRERAIYKDGVKQ